MRDRQVPGWLLEHGYPQDLPELPAPVEELISSGVPGIADVEALARSEEVLHWMLSPGAIWGAGVGGSVEEPDLTLLVDPEHPEGMPDVPRSMHTGERQVKVAFLELPHRIHAHQAPLLRNTAGALGGSAVSNDAVNMFRGAGGTLSGTFHDLGGHGQRGLTCAHVALGWGMAAFLANLPSSLLWLFQSPSGERMIVSDGAQIGQQMYELFKVDTPWPVLTWLPFAIPGPAAAFLFLDIAAGDVSPRALPQSPLFWPAPAPPAKPPVGHAATGAHYGSANYLPIGQEVYAIGQTLGLRWGVGLLAGLVFVLPIPLPGIPAIVIFNLNLYRLSIAPGDSGCLPATLSGDHPTGVSGIGLGGTLANPINPIALATPAHLVQLFANIRF